MSDKNPAAAFENLIESLEHRLKAALELKRLLHEYPDLADELRRYFADPANESVRPSRPGPNGQARKGTYSQQVVAFFESHGNRWTSAPDIVKATRLPRGGVAYVLYKTHAHRFQVKDDPSHGRKKLWRLKVDAQEGGLP